MEDQTSNDDEILKSPFSPKLGGKKLKLNDGSSQDSLKENGKSLWEIQTAIVYMIHLFGVHFDGFFSLAMSSNGEKDENVDSGVSADKSESTISDDRAAGTSEGPSNEVVTIAPSSSNVHTILLNIRRPKRGRNYRKRKTPERDTDSNDSSRDSDDFSPTGSPPLSRQVDYVQSESESDDVQRFSVGSASA